MFTPVMPPFDLKEWREKPFHQRLKMLCQSWAMQGYGSPNGVYIFYVLKIALFVGGWLFFCGFSPELGGPATLTEWWAHPVAFQKAIIWAMLFEVLGLGCGSGPLTGRYIPPVVAFLHFLWPGTTKMPFFGGVPVIGGYKRTIVDVAVYLGLLVALVWALVVPTPEFVHFLPIIIGIVVAGLLDKTIFLAARSEHYLTAMVVFAFADPWLPAVKWIWIALWLGAATSKLNHHFPSVITVMMSNSPFTKMKWFRKMLYKGYPDDLRASRIAHFSAHFGTVIEYTFPFLILFGAGTTVGTVGLVIMFVFHVFITSNIPMGVPLEWNVVMVYGAFVLFGVHADAGMAVAQAPVLAYLVVILLAVPIIGNFYPARFSFLCSMRYYAGNWAFSGWMFKKGTVEKLDEGLRKVSKNVRAQLSTLYDDEVVEAVLAKILSFRAMHLHGRTLQFLIPKAVDDPDDYEYLDGEIVAGLALGWNFGEGHLHNLQLLRAIQTQCHFEPGELRCIFVESTPMASTYHRWTIADAATGVLAEGRISTRDLLDLQPWSALVPGNDVEVDLGEEKRGESIASA